MELSTMRKYFLLNIIGLMVKYESLYRFLSAKVGVNSLWCLSYKPSGNSLCSPRNRQLDCYHEGCCLFVTRRAAALNEAMYDSPCLSLLRQERILFCSFWNKPNN